MMKKRIGMSICVIPDTQVKPGVPTDHLRALGNYIREKRHDAIVHLGDHADMPSLSSYDVGKAAAEGARVSEDIKAARDGMERLTKPFRGIRSYKPRMEYIMGNHDARLDRAAECDPKLIGTISSKDLGYEDFGWHVNPFLKVIKVEGTEFVHYVTTGILGRPASSAAAMLRQRHCSVIQGHVQRYDVAFHGPTRQTAIMAGTFYAHDEIFLGPQGNDCFRGVTVLNECRDGVFDLMMVSMQFLLNRYL
jgi:hypothetical protein